MLSSYLGFTIWVKKCGFKNLNGLGEKIYSWTVSEACEAHKYLQGETDAKSGLEQGSFLRFPSLLPS